jgi:hypothetical protein
LPPLFFASSLCFFFYSFNQINKKRAFEPLLPPLSLSLSLSLFFSFSRSLSLYRSLLQSTTASGGLSLL